MKMLSLDSRQSWWSFVSKRDFAEMRSTGEEVIKVDSRQVSRPIMPR
jgi:hypothetical protein